MHTLQPVFHIYYLTTADDSLEPPSTSSDATGSSAPKVNLDDLGCAIFGFLTGAIRVPKAKEIFVGSNAGIGLIRSLVEGVLGWTQITRGNVSGYT
jgi:hypothetical protein